MPARNNRSAAAKSRAPPQRAGAGADGAAAAAAAAAEPTCPGPPGRGGRPGPGCSAKQPVHCRGCARCDRHCGTFQDRKRHCDSDEDESEDEEGDAGAGPAAAAGAQQQEQQEEEEQDSSLLGRNVRKLTDFFGLSKSFVKYTYNPNAASGTAQYARQRAFMLLTRCAEKVGEILLNRSAPADIVQQWHRHEVGTDADLVQSKALEMLKTLPARSDGHRAVSALVCESSPKLTGKAIPGSDVRSIRSVKVGRALFQKMMDDKKLPELPAITRARGSDETIRLLVEFLISSENAQFLSWATKRVWCDDEFTEIPAVSRLKTIRSMFFDYERTFPEEKRVSWQPFHKIARAITGKQIKSSVAVDYHKVELINENKARQERLIKDVEHSQLTADVRKTLITEMAEVFMFIIHGFRSRIGLDDCASHSIRHALRIGSAPQEVMSEVTCPQTWAIFGWFEKLKSFLPEDLHVLVTESLQKVIIYMGHVVRTEVQQRRIKHIDSKNILVPKSSQRVAGTCSQRPDCSG